MYMVVMYDVEAGRTEKFKKLLRGFLNHTQYSVFTGDITEAQAIKLRRSLSQLMIPGDRVTEISAENRKNIDAFMLEKSDSGKGEIQRVPLDTHKRDFSVL
ncbi:MAG: CRISPR-associated endonuclease Cas2 [SAR324 cluster bacterium]|nr:CRISPR-associated endonuclease Cas2 [SAR324 cluster bacterium]